MKPAFLDSFYLLATFNSRDAAHQKALQASRSLPPQLIATEWVLTEVADALSDPVNRTRCVAFLEGIRNSPQITVEPASQELLDAGWVLYAARPDKNWSLTDCISFVVMQERRVTDALTGDHHFEQAGFNALLR